MTTVNTHNLFTVIQETSDKPIVDKANFMSLGHMRRFGNAQSKKFKGCKVTILSPDKKNKWEFCEDVDTKL